MSIATRTGDAGTTGLMYNRRVSKSDPRVDAYGSVDELNAALGLARANTDREDAREQLQTVQNDLIPLMGELATLAEDLERYVRDGYSRINPEATVKLDRWIAEIEAQNISFRGWATPGSSRASAAVDLARTVCRRAERQVCALQENGQLRNPEILVYLNRLSDWLWLLARWIDRKPENQLESR
jgi:cob(I)alamin adenosyltransferase